MKHLKMFGLMVMAATSMMAFAASASANPVLTDAGKPGVAFTGTIVDSLKSGTSLLVKAGITTTCTEASIDAHITTNNTTHVKGPITSLTLGKCGTSDVTTVTLGELTIRDDRRVFMIGGIIKFAETTLGVTCLYGGGESPGTELGSLSENGEELVVSTPNLKRQEGSNFFCAAEGSLTAIFKFTAPGPTKLLLT